MKREQVIQMARALGVWSEPITAEKLTVIVDHVIDVVTQQTFAEAARVCDDVEEPAWYGYECPNTFQDGCLSCAAAIRAMKGNP